MRGDASKSSRVFPAGGIINLGIRTAFQSFPAANLGVCLAARTRRVQLFIPGLHTRFFFRLLFLPDAEETAEYPFFSRSSNVLSPVSPSSSLSCSVAEVTRDRPRETYSVLSPLCLRSFLRFFSPATVPPSGFSQRQTNRSCCSLNEKCFRPASPTAVLHRTSEPR